jgi:P-type E1-E2 ATPase
MLTLSIPGRPDIGAEHLVLDVNGTLTVDGALIPGVVVHIAALKSVLHIVLVTADTFGTAGEVAEKLGIEMTVLGPGSGAEQKLAIVRALGSERVIAVGNGANDAAMLREAALGLCVLQTEGAAVSALTSADALFYSINDALYALLEPSRLIATLRA